MLLFLLDAEPPQVIAASMRACLAHHRLAISRNAERMSRKNNNSAMFKSIGRELLVARRHAIPVDALNT